MTPFQLHVEKWRGCEACPLCETRKNAVLWRGKIPCQVLFIGEAPGESEDAIGKPFIGPAGKKLDQMIQDSLLGKELRIGFTNVVACIPRDSEGKKAGEPDAIAIRGCRPRLKEIILLAKPKLIIFAGQIAQKNARTEVLNLNFGELPLAQADIVHPAFILKSPIAQQGMLIRKTMRTLMDAFEEVFPDA